MLRPVGLPDGRGNELGHLQPSGSGGVRARRRRRVLRLSRKKVGSRCSPSRDRAGARTNWRRLAGSLERARPRAQRGPEALDCRGFPACWPSPTLLRPRAGAQRHGRLRRRPKCAPGNERPKFMMEKLLGLPPVASEHGQHVDALIIYMHWLMIALFVGWLAYFAYVLVRFRRARNPKADYHGVRSHASSYIEGAVALIEGVLLVGLAIPLWAKAVDKFPDKSKSTVIQIGRASC